MSHIVRTDVDTRHLKSGQFRVRFRLSEQAHEIVSLALSMTPYSHTGAALDAVATSYHAGHPASLTLSSPAAGAKRLLVRLFQDQHENVRSALDLARDTAATDADALALICAVFVVTYQDEFSSNN